MVRARLSSKGQVTIPQAIRERYGLKEGDEVDFIAEERGSFMVPLKRRGLIELYGSVKVSKPWPGMATARETARKKRARELDRKAARA